MSKVVHLSSRAHQRAKVFCREHGLRMSDWVASLINEAVAKGRTDTLVRTPVQKKKPLKRLDENAQYEPNVPAYSMPPF